MENPAPFLKAVQSREQETADKHLVAGPEGAWCQDLRVVAQILKRLIGQVPTLFAAKQDPSECERLRQAFAPTKTQFQRLEQALAESGSHDR